MPYNLDTMSKQNNGPVSITSILIPINALKSETVDAIRNATIVATVNKAAELWGEGQALTVRDLNGTDMSYTNNIMTETSDAVANAWNVMNTCGGGAAFTVNNATVIGIYGIMLGCAWGTNDIMPITGIRIDVGGSRHAQWNVQTLDQYALTTSASPVSFNGGVTRSPVIVAEDITVTMYEYTSDASEVYFPVWLGVAVEKQGVTLKP